MVRLEKIVLHGFKSFKRPTAMTFPSNFAVVTGPNGCGKSNIGDSIAFVLGKGSSKHLRAKKAGDLVFHGSAGKNASDYAKVNLLFSNNQKILPMTETDVTVMRRLNKEGVSSYRLNGKMTTRQQMLDIFMQARMNPGGHNIIKQGDVSKIVDMNPIERRAILDEISGIKEYDEKKENALRQLSKVEEKVKEAEIILEQKEEIIDKLKAERDAAMEYQKLNMELELVKSTIIWKEFTVSEKKIGTLDKDIGETEEEVSKIQKEIDKIDVQMNAKDKELDDLMKEVMQQDQVEIMKKISKVESSLESKENMILSNDREISRLGDMIKNLTTFNRQFNPDMKPILDMQGVHGTLKDLVSIPEQYRIAAEVAGGNHMNDIVVENLNIAIQCVRYLKENRIGRARFLPLDKINSIPKRELPDGTLGWLSELMHHERQFSSVVDYVFGRTACVNDIDKAKNIAEKNRIRMVTLDGDIFETSGAVMGGHYRKKTAPETKKYRDTITKLEEESGILRIEIEELETKLGELNKGVERKDGFDYEKKNRAIKEDIENLRQKRRDVYETVAGLQAEVNRSRINKAKYEANFDNLKLQWEENKKKWESLENKDIYEKKGVSALKEREREVLEEIGNLGPVNMKAIDEFDILFDEFGDFKEKVIKIANEKDSVVNTINEIEKRKKEVFTMTMETMAKIFREIYSEVTHGDADLTLEDPNDLNSGLLISAQPPGKKLLYIDSMSGGEKTLTALAFMFAIQRHKPSPFYVLDEIDASLDRPNTRKIIQLIRKQAKDVQFIIISHNNEMVKAADIVYGISMEDGESKIIGIKLPKEAETNN